MKFMAHHIGAYSILSIPDVNNGGETILGFSLVCQIEDFSLGSTPYVDVKSHIAFYIHEGGEFSYRQEFRRAQFNLLAVIGGGA